MSSTDKHAVLFALIGITILTVLGVLIHALPWIREHQAEIGLALLLLILAVSGCVAAAALLLQLARPETGTETGTATDADTDALDCGEPDGLQEPTTARAPTAPTGVLR